MANTGDIALMAHLMRRAGFGAGRDEIPRIPRFSCAGARRRSAIRLAARQRPLPDAEIVGGEVSF